MSQQQFTPIDETNGVRAEVVRPHRLTTLMGCFGKMEVEISAARLISFFNQRGYWHSFKIEELAGFYKLNSWDPDPMFFGLTGAWYDDAQMGGWRTPDEIYLASDSKGNWCVTDLFIRKCSRNLAQAA